MKKYDASKSIETYEEIGMPIYKKSETDIQINLFKTIL